MDLLKLAFVVLLILLNGFFVATEFAVVKVRSTRIRILARKGSRRARLAEKITANLTAILSACQLGITLVTIGLGWAGEKWVTEIIFLPLVHGLGIAWISQPVLHSIAFLFAYAAISALHIIVGEQAPKGLAIQRAEDTALWVAAPIQAFYLLFFPIVWLLNSLSNLVLLAVGISPATGVEVAHGEEELRLVLARSRRHGLLTADEQRLMENVLNMTQKTARQAMSPRASVVFLSTQISLRENLWIARESGHTRFPLCDGDLDHVVGMVHIKDLFEARESDQLSADFHEVRREILFFPETVTLDRLLREFQKRRVHMAILVDEYGVNVGMITLEDVLEELVGEIQDEFDREAPPIVMIRPGQYRIDGMCPLDLFQQAFDLDPIESGGTTVGGLVFERCGHLPERGETVMLGDDRFLVESVTGQRIVSLRFVTQRRPRKSPLFPGSNATSEETP